MLTRMACSAYDQYQPRMQDHVARIRLFGALLWWLDQGNRKSPQARSARIPPELQGAGHPITLSDGPRHLQVSLSAPRSDRRWRLPPPSTH